MRALLQTCRRPWGISGRSHRRTPAWTRSARGSTGCGSTLPPPNWALACSPSARPCRNTPRCRTYMMTSTAVWRRMGEPCKCGREWAMGPISCRPRVGVWRTRLSERPADPRMIFALFNEIGIIEQLSRAMFEARLPKGVLVSHFAVLNHLVRVRDGRTPLELARAFQVPKTTLSHTLGLLEKRGWIEMRPNPADKRSKQVWITPEGAAFRDAAIASITPDLAGIAPAFPPEWVADLVPRLEALRRHLDARRDAP